MSVIDILEVISISLQILKLIIDIFSYKSINNKLDEENAIPIFLRVSFSKILNAR